MKSHPYLSSRSTSAARYALLCLAAVSSAVIGLASCDGSDGSSEAGANNCEGCCFGDGCGELPPDPPAGACIDMAPPDPVAVEIAAGTTVDGVFTEIAENQKMEIQYGSQGGQHGWVTLRIFTNETGSFQYKAQLDQAGIQAVFEGCGTSQWVELVDVPVFLYSDEPGTRTLTVSVAPVDKPVIGVLEIPVEL